jgi:hypothetical protein
MVATPDGGLYIYDTSLHQVLLRVPDGSMSVVAGNGVVGESGDGGLATRRRVLSWTMWGRWHWRPTGRFTFRVAERCEPSRHRASFRLSLAMASSISAQS